MSFSELQQAFHDYRSTVEQYFEANEERLKNLESKSQNFQQYQQVERIENSIAELEKRMTQMKTAFQRPILAQDGAMKSESGYHNAFMAYLKKGQEFDLSQFETKALSVGSEPDGGYLVPKETFGRILRAFQGNSAIRRLASTLTVGTDSLDLLAEQEECGAGWVAETGQRDETSTPKLAKIKIPIHEIYAEPRITQKLLDDANIDVEEWLIEKIVDKIGRLEEQSFLLGNGNGCPRGILTYENGREWGKIEQLKTGVEGNFKVDDPADILYDVVYTLPSGYLSGASWLMSRATLAQIRKLKNHEGHYLWEPALKAGEPATLLGYPVHISDAMPNIAKDTLSIAFGNFKQGYCIVDRQHMRILRDPFTAKPYVKYYTTKRVGGDVTQFDAIKLIQFSA